MEYFDTSHCPICNEKKFEILIKKKNENLTIEKLQELYSSSNDFFDDQVVKCINCKFVYINPRVKENIILEGYENVVDEKFITQDNLREKTFKNALEKLKKFIQFENLKNGLDVGTASGNFLKVCDVEKIDVEGIEPSKWMVDNLKKNTQLTVFNGSFENFKFKKKYDIIFFWDVLEHVYNLKLTINKVNEILNSDGYLVINAPDYDSFARKIFGKKWPFYLSVHLYYFNKISLDKLLNKNFSFIKKYPHFQFLELNYVLERAKKYFAFTETFIPIFKFLKLDKLPIKYNIGQTTFIYKKNNSV